MLSDKPWKLESVLMVAAGLLASMSIGLLITHVVGKIPNLSTSNEGLLRTLIGTLSVQGMALVLTHFFLRQHSISWREFLGLQRPDLPSVFLRAVLVALLAAPMALTLNALANEILTVLRSKPPELQPAIQTLEQSRTLGRQIFVSFSAVVLAPVAEEVIFRGILYATVKELGRPRLALFGTSILFAAIHAHLAALLPLTFFAIVLTLLYERTRSLLAPIIAHAGFNAVNLVTFFLVRDVLPRGAS